MSARRFFLLRAMSAVSLCCSVLACQSDVPYDDVGNGKNGNETPIKDISNDPPTGFQNKTIQSLGETGVGWSGVDILLVVDNSRSNVQGQTIVQAQTSFATEVYALVNTFLHPDEGSRAVKNIRLAVASTDMGLQWGSLGEYDQTFFEGCAGPGENGAFGQIIPLDVALEDGRIPCHDGSAQCPDGWTCQNALCYAPPQSTVTCDFTLNKGWIETTVVEPDPYFAQKAACLAIRGDTGCAVEQQLSSMRRALDYHPDFLNPNHLLLVLMLTDDDDCSIEDSALFTSDTWGTIGSTTCHDPLINNNYLFDTSFFHNELVQLKRGNPAAVFFAAVTGTPLVDACTGDGFALSAQGCLAVPEMQYVVEQSQLKPACFGYMTKAAPGRRLVEVAQMFGLNGYVESICAPKFSSLTQSVTARIQDTVENGQCLLSDSLETESMSSVCPTCQQSKCELYVEIVRTGDAVSDTSCPKALVFGDDYGEKAAFKQELAGGTPVFTTVFCPVQKSAVPLNCEAADGVLDETHATWGYCERPVGNENTEYACIDGVDNNVDGEVDCSAPSCADCMMCGALESACELGCKYDIILTPPARAAALGNNLFLECPYR